MAWSSVASSKAKSNTGGATNTSLTLTMGVTPTAGNVVIVAIASTAVIGISATSSVNITPFSPMAGGFTITVQPGASFTIVSSNAGDTMNFSYAVNSGNADNSYLPLKIYSPNLSQNNSKFDPITGNGTPGMAINVLINNHAFKHGTQGV